MRRIIKDIEPQSLTDFKINNPTLKYQDLVGGYENVRIDIRTSCLIEQYYLCAYCCDLITINDSHNEHIIPQSHATGENLTLDFNNIVASCQSNNHCGHKKQNQLIDTTPLVSNCETDIIYQLNGKITHKNPSSQKTINVLNLRDGGLTYKRKSIIDIILFEYVDDLDNLSLEDSEYLEMIIQEISIPTNGKLEAFVPVVISALRNFLA